MAEHDSVIRPGGSGTLTAVLKTKANQNGRLSKSISVVTDAEDARSLHLRFTVDVRTPIVARPGFRFTLNTITGAAASTRILLHRADGRPLEVAGLTFDEPELMFRARPVDEGDEPTPVPKSAADVWTELASRSPKIEGEIGDVWIDLEVRAPTTPGTRSGTLRFKTNDPDAPEMGLPYLVRVRPLIEARPQLIRLWLSDGGSGRRSSATISLRRSNGGELTITGVEVSDPEVFTAVADSTAAEPRQIVRVSVAGGLDESQMTGGFEGWIKVHTDEAEQPVVDIPIVVAPTAGQPLPTVRPATHDLKK